MPKKKPTAKTKDPDRQKAMELAAQKLGDSDLTLEVAQGLGIEVITAQQTQRLHPVLQAQPALKINYFDEFGKPLSTWPKHPPFYRVRYLPSKDGFAQLTDKPRRYDQLPNSGLAAYLPRGLAQWDRVFKDTSQPLIITEGELKAACASLHGLPTIGLGGVHNWHSTRKGITMLPELLRIDWVGRNAYLCFDDDYLTNPAVLMALKDFADQLIELGAYVHVTTLPSVKQGGKTGLDDFLVAEGSDKLREILHMSAPLGLTRPLFQFNEKYIYVRDPGLIVNQQTDFKVSPSAFKEHLESTKTYQELKLLKDGNISSVQVSAAAAWLGWPLRREASRLAYQPGQPKLGVTGEYNTWAGWGVQPAKGSVKPFLQLIDHLWTGSEAGAKEWFLDWCAYPLQHPGTKLFSSVVIHGVRNGTGKSLVGYVLGRIYGKNFTEINQGHLHQDFNEWAENKQLVMGDDVTGSNKRSDADLLKKLITQKELRVNVKYLPSFVVADCINYLFTSNHPDAFFLEDDDRRFNINEVVVGPLSGDFYMKFVGWLDAGGAAAVFDWFLNRDLSGFNPAAAAFKTDARARMLADVQSDLGAWVRMLLETPDVVLRVGQIPTELDLVTSKELLNLYDPLGKTGTTANGLGRELRRAGVIYVCNGHPLKLPDGVQQRYYAIRNREKWRNASPTMCLNHLTAPSNLRPGGKKPKY